MAILLKNENQNINAARWGIWGTILGSIIIVITSIILSIISIVFYIVINNKDINLLQDEKFAKEAEQNGFVLSLSITLSFFICGGILIGFAKLKKGSNLREYFGFYPIKWSDLRKWGIAMLVLILFSELITIILKKPIVPEFMTTAYFSTNHPWFLFFAIIIAAPFLEELYFRGFLFEGVKKTAIGPIGAILITSVLWSVIHLQYDLHGIMIVFFIGLLMGYIKHRTGSIYLTIFLHALNNAIACVELLIVAN